MLNRRALIRVVIALATTITTQAVAQDRGGRATPAAVIVNLLATWIPALIIALLGVLKLVRNRRVVHELTALGVERHLRALGTMELAFATLFVFPATFKLGFLLASCYFGGAIATELSHGKLKPNPFVPIVLLWIGALTRDRSIFF